MSLRLLEMAARALRYRPNLDMFASAANKVCPRYWAAWMDPEAEAVNAFQQSWSAQRGRRLYANPPWTLLTKVLLKADQDGAELMLVHPIWRAAPWWPTLKAMTVETITLPDNEVVYLKAGLEPMPPPKWRTGVTLLQGRRSWS